MLYRGSEIMREVAWAVFDEIHSTRRVDCGMVREGTKYSSSAQCALCLPISDNTRCHAIYRMDTYSGGDGIPLVVNGTKNVISGESYKKAQVMIQLTEKRERGEHTLQSQGLLENHT